MKYTNEEKIEALKRVVIFEDREYYSKADFAIIIGKHPSAISKLIYHGNCQGRRLKAMRLGNAVFILKSELTNFPHFPVGKRGLFSNVKPYFYDEYGNIIPTEIDF